MARTLLHVFATFAVGGPQIRFATIANHFGREYRHLIVATDGNMAARERLDPGLDLAYPPLASVKGDTVANVRRFRAALRTIRPHTLFTNNFGSIEWAMANRLAIVRHVHTEDGFGPEERDRQLPRRVMLRRAMLRGRTVVLPSRTLLGIARDVWRLDQRRLRYVPNGIDLARFAAGGDAAPWPRDMPVIGTVAALRPEKNLGRLIRAFALLGDVAARLVLVGDGGECGALQALAASLGVADRVIFAGHVAQPERVLGGIDVFALTSDTEQMPLSVLEAMAAGLPVVATDVGDVRAMLSAENAPFVAPRDDRMVADCLRTLLLDAGLRQTVGAANRMRAVAEFDQARMFRSWGALFDGEAVHE